MLEDEKVISIQAYANTLGTALSSKELSDNFGIDSMLTNALFVMYNSDISQESITLQEFAKFIASDEFLNNSTFNSNLDEATKKQLIQFSQIIQALDSNVPMSSNDIASMLDIDVNIVKTVLFFSQLQTETVLFKDFVGMITEASERLSFMVDKEMLSQLNMLQTLSRIVESNQALTATDFMDIVGPFVSNNSLSVDVLQLFIAMVKGHSTDLSELRIPLYDMFGFLSNNFINNPAYSLFVEDEMKAQFTSATQMMEDGKSQLVGTDHSRMIITTAYRHETQDMLDFHSSTNALLGDTLLHDFYLVGESAMSYEVRHSFSDEYTFISILTAIAVLIVVCITFKSFFLPVLLVAIIECSVFSMMSVMVAIDHSMFFIALILVQCILMGSMIDYAILLTTYYIEVRKELSAQKALPEVMKRSMHAILTSGSILVVVSFVCGRFMSGQVASILQTLGIGALCALILILFVLPALLAVFDRQVVAKWVLPVPVVEAVTDDNETESNNAENSTIDQNQITIFD